MFIHRIKHLKPGAPTIDRFGNERPGPPTEVDIPTPVSIQQRTSVDHTNNGDSVLRVESQYIVISQPGYTIDGINPADLLIINGETWLVEGPPIQYVLPVKHTEIIVKRVEG